MGDAADYDMHENINNIGKFEQISYTCGLCHRRLGNDKRRAQSHVDNCDYTKKEEE